MAEALAQRTADTPNARTGRWWRVAFGSLAVFVSVLTPVVLSGCGATGGSSNTGVPATLAPGGSTFTGGTLPNKLHTVIKSGTLTAGGTSTSALTTSGG